MGTNETSMGCGGSKDKKDEGAPAPVEQKGADAPTAAEEGGSAQRQDNTNEFVSKDLQELMQDYFNRYDLDGSSTINSSEELKQLCTNLVVKLDLPLDVADIDRIVHSAGAFADDPFEGDDKPDDRNEWYLDDFIKWFMPGFEVPRDWIAGDESDEDEEQTDEIPFVKGTYIGEMEGGGKKYVWKRKNKDTHAEEDCFEFSFKVRYDDADPKKLKERKGCDSVGYYRQTGSLDGKTIKILREYDIDGDLGTVEPSIEFTGDQVEGEPHAMSGTWKNLNAEEAGDQMKLLGLEGVQEGTFKVTKRIRDDA